MTQNSASNEFEFIRHRLERVARLLTQMDPNSIVEASFVIGCLHTICSQNAIAFQVTDPTND